MVLSPKNAVLWLSLFLLVIFWAPSFSRGEGPEPHSGSGGGAVRHGGQTTPETPGYQDYALLIAGLQGRQGPLAPQEADSAWANYARAINRSWANFEKERLAVMRKWAARELAPAAGPTVFYPFSGPDVVNMVTLFPQAQTYLMVSLEPVGGLPDFAGGGRHFFACLQRSLHDLLHLTFFITPNLESSLGTKELKGVLPVLLFFLAREGVKIQEVHYWFMKPGGAIEELPAGTGQRHGSAGDLPGLRIVFERPDSPGSRTLYYFRFNLRNDSFERHQHLVSFLEKFGPFTTFSKAASYLMHKPYFSRIRQFILDKSASVLQSDAAIPLQYFDPSVWQLRFYGTYKGPIGLFRNRYQADLAAVYQRGQDVHALPFGICYRHRPQTSNLMFAVKKASLAEDHSDCQ